MNITTKINDSNNIIHLADGAIDFPLKQKVQTFFSKAKEAEDASIYPFRPMMRRSYSLSQLDPTQKTEKEECEARSGAFWECVGRKPSKFGGYIYLFKIREEYNDFTLGPGLSTRANDVKKKRAEIFPALEVSANDGIVTYDITYDIEEQIKSRTKYAFDVEFEVKKDLISACPDSEIQAIKDDLQTNIENAIRAGITFNAKLRIPFRKNAKTLQEIGYQFSEKNGQVFKEAPDREALLGAYHNLKEIHPERTWPDFQITSSEGIADDESYALAHFTGGLLSTGFEFNHDLDSHIVPRLHRLFEGTDYYQKTERELIHHVFSVYKKIYIAKEQNPGLRKYSEKLNFLLGMTADTLFSLSPADQLENKLTDDFVRYQIENVCEELNWESYVQRRFPTDTPRNAEMTRLWNEVENRQYSLYLVKI